jgi:hypothetical protein
MSGQKPVLTPSLILAENRRRKEWVELSFARLCVWEMTVLEITQMSSRAARPAIDPRGGVDPQEMLLWNIALSCYDGDGPEASRIFDPDKPADVRAIFALPLLEMHAINQAIARVNGTDEEAVGDLTEFIKATAVGLP